METVNSVHDQEKISPKESIQNISQKSIGNSAEARENIEIVNSKPSNSAPAELAHLLCQASKARKKSVKAKQEEILSWGRYSEAIPHRISDEYLRKITTIQKIIEEVSRNEDAIASESLPETEIKINISTKSHVSDSYKAEMSALVSPLYENKTQPSISILFKDPKEKRKHIIKTVLEKENLEDEWGSGDYVNTSTYRLRC
ncbi:16580_t:CDS:2 [Acaulospora morrowiae]|uniref:16580_t:CDS:1 n=1 Tax=Acaulospora morrowiae TaxID=94023 RepID=A0A9N9F9N3_9GLOM|nr:16580_t:CDS:2 [Acaulospora morrowiae]